MPSSVQRPRLGGFSLLETVVALAILAWVLLWTGALLVEERRIQHRLDAHAEALDVLQTVHESIRGGFRLRSGENLVDWQGLYDPPPELRAAEELKIWTQVEPSGTPGLVKLTLKARYFVGPEAFGREFDTLVWSG